MFGLNRSSESIYEELVAKALALAAVQQIGDSSIKRILRRVYNVSEAAYNTFKSGLSYHGIMSDGLDVSMPVTVDSYNVLTNVVLSTRKNGEISTSSSRFGNNLNSIFVYVNGKKVPDSAIWLYMTDSYTNIIIPKTYFDLNPLINNDMLIEVRQFDAYTYGGTRVKNFTGNLIEFDISSHRNLTVNANTCMVFVNGNLTPDNINSVIFSNGKATVNLINTVVNGDVEVFIDSSIKYVKSTRVSGTNITPFSIDDSFIDPLYGPINIDNCLYFIDGLRISNADITQAGRVNFEYKLPNGALLTNDLITIVFTDNAVIPMAQYELYGDDYFLYNFLGTSNVTKALLGIPVNETFDRFVNYRKMLGENLTYQKAQDTINALSIINDDVLKIQMLIQNFPMLVKDFLEVFSAAKSTEVYHYDGTTPTVLLGFNDSYDIGTDIIRIITVNGKVAKVDRIIVSENNNKYWQSTVDAKWFVVGDNVVDIIESVQTGDHTAYKVLTIERLQPTFDPYTYRAECDLFGNVQSLDDFRVLALTKREYDPDGIYFKDDAYGFKILNGVARMIYNGKIYLDFGSVDPRIDMLIITSLKHHNTFRFSVDNFDTSYDSLFNELYIGEEQFFDNNIYHSVKVPLIHNGNIILSSDSDGSRLFRDVDYFYRSPFDTPNLRDSGIIMKRIVTQGETINVVVFPTYTYNNEYPSLSISDTGADKYGLLYLGNLKFPFSPKYIDVYANNKLIGDNDIDILSNKLIRLYKEEVSLQNVYIESNFAVPFASLRPFIQLYSDSDFERNIASLFACYNYFNIEGSGTTSKEQADILYASFASGVDSNAKTPNPIRQIVYVADTYNLYVDAYLRWFISDRSNHNWDAIANIPDKVLRELDIFRNTSNGGYEGLTSPTWTNVTTYYENDSVLYNGLVYICQIGNVNNTPDVVGSTYWKLYNFDVVVFPYLEELISDIVIATSPDMYPGFFASSTVRNFLDCCVAHELSIQDCFVQYDNFSYGNRVFKRDLLPISAIEFFEGDDILMGRGPTMKFGG